MRKKLKTLDQEVKNKYKTSKQTAKQKIGTQCVHIYADWGSKT